MGRAQSIAIGDARPTVHCTTCGGTGRAPLTPALVVTLDGNRTVRLTALANRLADLARYGLVERRPSMTSFRNLEWRRAL